MSDTIPTWGYCKGGSQIFELKPGEGLPKGWYDSPAKIPASAGPGEGGAPAVADSHPPQQVAPPLPSIEQQEAVAYAALLAENGELRARVAELEAQLADLANPLMPEPGLPLAPGASMGEILAGAGPGLEPDIEGLRARARELGVRVDNRWGVQRLQAEIAAVGK
jgi:hypothetical protein